MNIDQIDDKLAKMSARIGNEVGADSVAIITIKGNAIRIYAASPGNTAPSHEEASQILKDMASGLLDRAKMLDAKEGKFEEVNPDKPDTQKWEAN